MSPVVASLNALLAVQAVDSKIERAKKALSELDSGETIAAAYTNGKTEFDRLKAQALKAEAAQKDAELRLQTIEAKIEHENALLFGGTITASRELENLQRELDMLERQRQDAEAKVMEAMDAVNEAVSAARDREAHLVALATRHKEVRGAFKKQQAALANEMKTHELERLEAMKGVPEDLLRRYEAIRSKKNGVGIVPMLDNGACGGCYTLLSKGLASAVRAAHDAETCEFCGRFLVPPPQAAPPVPAPRASTRTTRVK